ncbi:MAG: XRE family transcriptional regulator [Alcanivorax sp.]|nr:XRE family transcriptional regulator [Alcanivorax sp.]
MKLAELFDDALLAELGRRLRLHRIQAEWTQDTLADRARVSRSTLSKIEQGRPVKLPEFLAVLRALDLLDTLDQVLPDPARSPLLRYAHEQGKLPQRVRHTSSPGIAETTPRWPEDQEPEP